MAAPRVITTTAVFIGVGLLLLCGCARPPSLTVTPTDAPLFAATAVPSRTTLFLPTDQSLPPSIELADEPLTYTLNVTDPGPPATDLAIQAPGSVQVIPGETTVYTLTVRNQGPAPTTGIVLTDVFPPGVIPLWIQPTQPVCRRQERTVSCEAGDFRESDTITVALDLFVGGAENLVTGTQLAGVSWDLSRPACTIDRSASSPHVTCRLASLQSGDDAHVRVGIGVDARTPLLRSQSLVHTVTVVANEADPDRSNNRATFTMTVGPSTLLGTGEAGPAPSKVEGAVTSTSIPTTATDLVLQADGPISVIAGQPFTYAFTITNRGALDATGVYFEDTIPPAAVLHAYAPGLPHCEQRDDTLTCTLRDLDSGEAITFTVVITGHAGQPMKMELDPLMPGWPICTVLKERSHLHIVNCELGVLRPGQATHVQLALIAGGVLERVMTNTVSVRANEAELNTLDNTNTTTITVRVRADLLVRSVVSGPAVAGKTLSYTLTAVNLGPSNADVILTDTLPMGTRLISATSSRGDDCRVEREEPTTDTIICNLGRLNGGETVTVTMIVAVDESLTLVEEILHSARVVAEQADPNPDNNELTQTIPVSGTKD